MMYPEEFVHPMREEVTIHDVRELRTSADVDSVLQSNCGTVLVFVNSICGCAAGKARPGLALALQHRPRPDVLATVFAGQDLEATVRARSYFAQYPPSSPSVLLMKDGKAVEMIHRYQIENQTPQGVASLLIEAFGRHCSPEMESAAAG